MGRSSRYIIEQKQKIAEPENVILFMKTEKKANENTWLHIYMGAFK